MAVMLNTSAQDEIRLAASQTQKCPVDYINTWIGFGDQNNSGEWPIRVNITGGQTGEVIGTIDYPSLHCGGTLSLAKVKTGEIILYEKLTYGLFRCIDRGTVTLTMQGEAVKFFWYRESFPDSWAMGILGLELNDFPAKEKKEK